MVFSPNRFQRNDFVAHYYSGVNVCCRTELRFFFLFFSNFNEMKDARSENLMDYEMQWTMDRERIGLHYDNVLCNTSKILSSSQTLATSTKKINTCVSTSWERTTPLTDINIRLLQEILPARKRIGIASCTHYVTLNSPPGSARACYLSRSKELPSFISSKISGEGSLISLMSLTSWNLMQLYLVTTDGTQGNSVQL